MPNLYDGERTTKFTRNEDLISRLNSFLPKLENANLELNKKIASDESYKRSVCIDECVVVDDEGLQDRSEEPFSKSDGQYIEMNLGVGVFDCSSKLKDKHIKQGQLLEDLEGLQNLRKVDELVLPTKQGSSNLISEI